MQQQSITLCDNCQATFIVDERPLPPWGTDDHFTEYTPSETEISIIKAHIEHTERGIHRYDAEISKLSGILATLTEQRKGLQKYRDRCLYVVAPVNKLPVELLTEIFLACCSPSLLVDVGQLETPTLAISQTCSVWRHVALHTPELWSDLCVNIAFPQSTLLDLYLSRSKSHPLTLDVNFERDGPHSPLTLEDLSPSGSSMLVSLINAGDRWLSACLDFPGAIFNAESIWTSSSRRYPVNLKYLSVRYYYPLNTGRLSQNNNFFTHATALENFEISSWDPLFVPVNGLTELRVTGTTIFLPEILWVFQNCPNLYEFEFFFDGDGLDNIGSFVHNKLQCLTGGFWDDSGIPILSFATLPALTTLDLTGRRCIQSNDLLRSVKDMIQRSACQLEVLRLAESTLRYVSKESLLDLLDLTPTLYELSITLYRHNGALVNDLFQLLIGTSPTRTSNNEETPVRTFLPQLDVFRVTLSQGHFQDADQEPSIGTLPDPGLMMVMLNSRTVSTSLGPNTACLAFFALTAQVKHDPTTGEEWIQALPSHDSCLHAAVGGGWLQCVYQV